MSRYTDPRMSESEIAAMVRSSSEDPIAEIRYTANRIDPDEMDENPNYEPESGWWNPEWSYWEIWDEPESALTEEVTGEAIAEMVEDGAIGEDLSPADLLDAAIQEMMSEHLGSLDSWDGWNASASDSIQNYRTGISIYGSAHATYSPPSLDAGDQLSIEIPS